MKMTLTCPKCEHDQTTHGAVDVYQYDHDGSTGHHINAHGDEVRVNGDLNGNPNQGKNCVSFVVFCGKCKHISCLTVSSKDDQTIISNETPSHLENQEEEVNLWTK